MSTPAAVLRQIESHPLGRCPPHVQPISRPAALGRAVELAFLRWEKRQLEHTERFWRDFGLAIASADSQRVVARGTGTSPCIAIATRGPADRFVGVAFRMSDDTDLRVYRDTMQARPIPADEIPGGGRGVELTDPAGRSVWLLQGQATVPPLPNRAPVTPMTNSAVHAPRVNRTVRTPIEPA